MVQANIMDTYSVEKQLCQQDKLVSIAEHCDRLAMLLAQLDALPLRQEVFDEGISWLKISDQLHVASSILDVEVNTARFDDSVIWCETAWEFESERSKLLSQMVTQFVIFTIVWGSFESVIKMIDLPQIPKTLKAGRSSPIDQAIFFLKTHYEPRPLPRFYELIVADLKDIIKQLPEYNQLSSEFRLQPHYGISGIGAHIVRRIRNMFAHGVISFPYREEEGLEEIRLIEISTRITLLTIQMLLFAYFKDQHLKVEWCDSANGEDADSQETVQDVLLKLHLRRGENIPNGQLRLF